MTDLNPLDLLKEELESDDVGSRVNAIHKLRIVATLLGPDGCKNTLLPFLDSLARKEDDEVLFAIAEQLGQIAPLFGNFQMSLVPLLQTLSGQDETVVRDMAVKSLVGLMANVSDSDINTFFTPMILRLASNEANFTCRVSAVNMMCKVYKRAGGVKDKIRQKFVELSNEETPMVRRVIAVKIGQIASVYEKEYIISDLIPALKQLTGDEQDLVRVLCLDSLIALGKILSREDNKTHLLPIIIQAAEDKSWRVRLALSKNFAEIAQSFGKQITDLSLVQIFNTLLKDVQNDVKIEAVKSLAKFVKLISPDKLNILLPLIITLGKDPSSLVRSNLTAVLSNITGIIPKDQAYQRLLPLISDMMKDDNQDARQGAIKAMGRFAESVGHDILPTILPQLRTATEDLKWRVRSVAINTIASISIVYQNYDVYANKGLEQLFLTYVRDKAAAVRESAIEKIPALVKAFGQVFVGNFLAKLVDLYNKESGHNAKITILYSLQALALSPGGEGSAERVLQVASKSLNETIPNVRVVAVKVIQHLCRFEGLKDVIRKTLSPLVQDVDKDVKYYANEALASL